MNRETRDLGQGAHRNRLKLAAVVLLVLLAVSSPPLSAGPAAGGVSYVDVAEQVGLDLSHDIGAICDPPIGVGGAWADYDEDDDLDLFVSNRGGPNHLYRNEGDRDADGLPDFGDVAAQAGVDAPALASMGATFVDYDNDGDQDLYVTNWDGNSLYQNQLSESGSPVFVDVAAQAGVDDSGRAITAAWGDFDQNGYLDLYLAKHIRCAEDPDPQSQDHLYSNNGDGSFTDVTGWLCPGGIVPCDQVSGLGFSPVWLDYDNDGDLDLYLANDDFVEVPGHYPNVLWRNDGPDAFGGWRFVDVSAFSGAGLSANAMGLGVGDYNNDGWLDLAFSNLGPNNLLRNNRDGTFADVSAAAGIQREFLPGGETSITWGTAFFDGDNDGWLDLYFVAGDIHEPLGQPNAFFSNNRDGTFTDLSSGSGLDDPSRGRHASLADFDGDGFVDVFVGNYGEPPALYHSQGNANRWLAVTVEGTVSNRDGIGARLWLTTPDGMIQTREISTGPTHGGGDHRATYFGLAQHTSGNLQVRWPSGFVQNIGDVAADQQLHLIEPAVASERFRASLTGQENVPPTDTGALGWARLGLNATGDELQFELWAKDIRRAFTADIHCAPPGANGPRGVGLWTGGPVTIRGTRLLAEGGITSPDAGNACGWASLQDVATAMRIGEAYVSYHTRAYPAGEIRGQIEAAGP